MTDVDSDIENGYSGYFIVAFVDLLGTDDKNAEIKAQPEFPSEMLEREVGKVKAFQRDFHRFFDAAANIAKRFDSQRPENLKSDFEKLKGNAVTTYAFSDALIFYASLNMEQGRLVPVESCFVLLAALACTQLFSLARGLPFRGGVEIGRAAVFNGNQILGPALSDAVKLEKRAQFPRTLIGEGANKYLHLHTQLPPDTPEKHANRTFADFCTVLMCESSEPNGLCTDGYEERNVNESVILSLDVLADFVVELIGGKQKHQELVTKARKFAESQIQKFSSQEEYNEKLACRYRHLLDYLGL